MVSDDQVLGNRLRYVVGCLELDLVGAAALEDLQDRSKRAGSNAAIHADEVAAQPNMLKFAEIRV